MNQTRTFLLFALLAEIGLIGMSLFIALLCCWTADAWQLGRSSTSPLWARQQGLLFLAMMGSYLTNAMFHDLSIIPMVNMVLFFLAGLTSGLSYHAKARAVVAPALSTARVAAGAAGYASA